MDYILKAKLACLSTDEKPIAIPGYTDDLKYSVLWELDTDKKYYYNGEEWVEIGTAQASEYLLHNAAIEGTYDSEENVYTFAYDISIMDADVLAALREDISGGGTPSLILSCDELNVSNLELSYVDGNWSDGESAYIEIGVGGGTILIASENIGATIEGTFTLSYEETK